MSSPYAIGDAFVGLNARLGLEATGTRRRHAANPGLGASRWRPRRHGTKRRQSAVAWSAGEGFHERFD